MWVKFTRSLNSILGKLLILSVFLISAPGACMKTPDNSSDVQPQSAPFQEVRQASIVVLGTVQDGGSPHIGCERSCCSGLFEVPDPSRKVVSLGLIDPKHKKRYMLEASPDFTSQLDHLNSLCSWRADKTPDGIFLTHAHIGHYTGVMYLGREAMGARGAPVYAMPRMEQFLRENGPWSQLVELGNIDLNPMVADDWIELSPDISISAFRVPHRDEFSETVGYKIQGPQKSALFIPDIDKWEKWERDIVQEIQQVDYALLDATFFDGNELPGRDMSEVPHPFVIESMKLFESLSKTERSKVYFIHFNHTNPALDRSSRACSLIHSNGFEVAEMGMVLEL